MGCCFSKELSNDSDNEKIGLLQKCVEEKKPETKISKTYLHYLIPLKVRSFILLKMDPAEQPLVLLCGLEFLPGPGTNRIIDQSSH